MAKYTDLFGLEGPVDSGVTDWAEHGRVGNVSTGQPFKFTSLIDPDTGNTAAITADGKIEVNSSATITGADGAITDGVSSSIKATVKDLNNSNPLTTAIVDANGDQITSFGGGTQYTEGDTDSSITGTAVMWEDRGNTLRPSSHIYPLPVDAHFDPGSIDSFGHFITGEVNNQIDIQWYRSDGTVADLVTETNANGGTATATGGMATFSATTTANSSAKGVTNTTTVYTAGSEIYTLFTAGWTGTGSGTSYQRIGLYDDNNGFFIGFEGGTFYATIRKGGVDTKTAKASFSEDALTGAATSKFTRNGTPEAIDLTKLNVWKIRFGWVGSAPISYEVLSPDGHWVTFHKILQPNLAALPSIEDADLPVTCHVNSGNSGAALTLITNCWAGGTTQSLARMDATITDATFAQLTRSVITGETSAGGGAYVNVKVNPSGALETNSAISSLPNEGQQTMANSISVAIASNQSAVPVSATDLDIRDLTSTDIVTVTGGAGQTADVKVTLDGESVPVTGTFYQATQPVSLASVPSHDVTNAGTFAVQATGTVTANAGTNLNTSALALESGGNLAEIKTNTDNIPAVGQALMAASTPVVIASNQSAVPVTLTSTTVTGTVAVTQSGTWDEVGINDSGNSITVDQSTHDNFNANANLQIGNADVTTSNPVPIQPPLSGYLNIAIDQTGNNNAVDVLTMPTTTVTATDLDIRNLVFATDKVDVSGSTLAANSGVDIGDVTINNASGASAVNIQDGGNTITVDGTVTVGSITAGDNNIGNVDVVTLPSIPAGTNNIGDVDAIQSGTWTVQPGNTQNTTAWLVSDVPVTSGGLSKFHLVAAATTNATNIKASAGQVYAITAFNLNASARYLKFHNTSGTPTAGSGVTDTYMIPGNTAGTGLVLNVDKGIAFSTGIGITIVAGIDDTDSTAVAASQIVVNIYYK